MIETTDYVPPKVWHWNKEEGGRSAAINRPFAGATHDKELPVGRHPLQLYSLATPNGVKVTIMLEELLDAGHAQAEYVDRRSTRDPRLLWAKCLSNKPKACSKGGFRATPICTVPVSPCCAQSMS